MNHRRAFSTIEIVLALGVTIMAMVVFMSVFSSSSRYSVQNRNRTVAIMLAHSLMDEFEAHPYGVAEPKSWTSDVDKPVRVWVEGRPQVMEYHKKIEYENGSFIGKTNDNRDLITVTISWREGVGTKQPGGVGPEDDKVLTFRMPVWR